MTYPVNKIGCVANLYSRQMHFLKAGDKEEGHSHVFDHLTLLACGSVQVTAKGKTTKFKAPNMIYIAKDVNHEIVALEDNTVVYCIHPLRDGDAVGDIIDPESIPDGIDPLSLSNSLIHP